MNTSLCRNDQPWMYSQRKVVRKIVTHNDLHVFYGWKNKDQKMCQADWKATHTDNFNSGISLEGTWFPPRSNLLLLSLAPTSRNLIARTMPRTIEISTKRVSRFLWLDLKFQDLTSRLILTVKNESNSPVWTGYIRIQWIWCQLQFWSTTLSRKLDRSC